MKEGNAHGALGLQHSTPRAHTDLPRIFIVAFFRRRVFFENYRQIVFARSVFYELNVRRGRNAYMKYCERGEDDNDSIFMFCELFLCALLSLSHSSSHHVYLKAERFSLRRRQQKNTSICE